MPGASSHSSRVARSGRFSLELPERRSAARQAHGLLAYPRWAPGHFRPSGSVLGDLMVAAPHSPLPPPMPATLDLIAGKLDHAITVLEVTSDRVRHLEEAHVKAEKIESSMRSLVLRLSSASIAMATSRAVSAVATPTRALGVMAAGAFAGGFLGTLVWQTVRAHTALASLLP